MGAKEAHGDPHGQIHAQRRHGNDHDNDGENQRRHKGHEVALLGGTLFGAALLVELRTILLGDDIGHKAQVIDGGADLFQVFLGRVEGYCGRVGRQIHCDVVDTGHAPHHLLDDGRAAGAGHALHRQPSHRALGRLLRARLSLWRHRHLSRSVLAIHNAS